MEVLALQSMDSLAEKSRLDLYKHREGTDSKFVDIQGKLSVQSESYRQVDQQHRLQFDCIAVVPSPPRL